MHDLQKDVKLECTCVTLLCMSRQPYSVSIVCKLCYNVITINKGVSTMEKIERKVTKIGNSIGITLPPDLLREAGISYGDDVQLEAKDGKIILQKKSKHHSQMG